MVDPNAPVFFGLADRPIFIGGLMKSGTNLLRVLLGQHPDLYGGLETHWFDPAIRLNWYDRSSQRMKYLAELFELGDKELGFFVEIKENEPEREFVDIVLEGCAQRAGKKRWVEKTPGNLLHFSLIGRQWVGARFIHVKREYRDCFASWKDRRGDNLETFLESAKKAYQDIGHLLGSRTANYMEVDYAQLVSNPEPLMREILDFCDLEWTSKCASLDLESTCRERKMLRSLLGRDSHTHIALSKPIFTGQIGQWKGIVTEEEAVTIRKELSEFYERIGEGWADGPLPE